MLCNNNVDKQVCGLPNVNDDALLLKCPITKVHHSSVP